MADGLTENIITTLSAAPYLFVIASNSSFAYKDQRKRIDQIANELSVRYILEGGFQAQKNHMRISARLVDTQDNKTLWNEKYDRVLDDWFELQDDIAESVLISLGGTLKGDDEQRTRAHMGSFDAYRSFLKAGKLFYDYTPEANFQAVEMVKNAIEAHENETRLYSLLGGLLWQRASLGFSTGSGDDLKKAEEHATKSVELEPLNEHGHYLLAMIAAHKKEYQSAIAHADRAIEIAPNAASNIAIAALAKGISGQHQESLDLLEKAMRIDPYHWPWIANRRAYNLIALGRYTEAKSGLDKLVEGNRILNKFDKANALVGRAIAAYHLGEEKIAQADIERVRTIIPTYSIQNYESRLKVEKDRNLVQRILDSLKKMELPEG